MILQAILEISVVLQQLGAAGHPSHQYTAEDKVFSLSEGLLQLRRLASDLQQTLAKWQEQIQAVHLRFTHSEFLSTHQLVAASELLSVILAGGMCLRWNGLSVCHMQHRKACNKARLQCCSMRHWTIARYAASAHGNCSYLQRSGVVHALSQP